MKIATGLFENMVLQRTAKDVCDVRLKGETAARGTLVAKVTVRGKPVPGFHGKAIGRANGRTFEGRLTGLKVGGPYDIALSITDARGEAQDSAAVANVLVGDVWLLGGQSNMQGYGRWVDREKPHPLVRAFYMTDEWDVAEDPLHQLGEAVDQVHSGMPAPAKPITRSRTPVPNGVGPGVTFGKGMLARTGVPQGLVACAHGGTSMSQWDPTLKKLKGKSLYGAMVRRFHKTCGRVRGVVWYQGCADAGPEAAPLYTRRMKTLVASMRRDFGTPRLPIAVVQIARVFGCPPSPNAAADWNSIQEQQRRLSSHIAHCTVVPAIDMALDDSIHVSGKDNQRLGERLAQAMSFLVGCPAKSDKPPIALRDVQLVKDRYGHILTRARFTNVIGSLRAPGEPAGFSLLGPDGQQHIYRVELDGDSAICRSLSVIGHRLHYGAGFAPYCNITDRGDRSLPVFGPLTVGDFHVPIKIDKAFGKAVPFFIPSTITPFLTKVQVSKAQPSAGKLQKLAYPRRQAALGFKVSFRQACEVRKNNRMAYGEPEHGA